MDGKFEKKGFGILDRVKYRFQGIPRNIIEQYNRVVDAYNSELYENALGELWELWYRQGSTKLPEFYRMTLSLIEALSPEQEIEAGRRVVSGLSTLMELWMGGHQYSKGAEEIYEVTMRTTERLPYDSRIKIQGQDVSLSNLLILLWQYDDSSEKIEDFDLRTIEVLKGMPKEDRDMTLGMIEDVRRQMEQYVYNGKTRDMREKLNYVEYKIRMYEKEEEEQVNDNG